MKNEVAGVAKHIVNLCFVLIVAIVSATVIMIGLYSIPTSNIYNHAKESVSMYENGGVNKVNNWAGGADSAAIANFTDSIMINNAICRYYDSAIKNAMLNPRYEYSGVILQQVNLAKYLSGEENYEFEAYSRYWHGYLLYIILGLLFMNVGEIKLVMMMVQFLLTIAFFHELGKRSWLHMILFGFVSLFINPVTTILSFQYADIYCIMMIFTLIVLKYQEVLNEKNRYIYLFAINGICVAFFDFLTYPLVAYGVPLITFLVFNKDEVKKTWGKVISSSAAWGFGYAGMWMGKWIMASVLTGENQVSRGLVSVAYRTAGDSATKESAVSQKYFDVLKALFDVVVDKPTLLLFVVAVLIIVFYMKKKHYSISIVKGCWKRILPIAIVGMSPFVWVLVVRNHTATHPILEYREFAVTLWALFVIIIECLGPKTLDNKDKVLK